MRHTNCKCFSCVKVAVADTAVVPAANLVRYEGWAAEGFAGFAEPVDEMTGACCRCGVCLPWDEYICRECVLPGKTQGEVDAELPDECCMCGLPCDGTWCSWCEAERYTRAFE